MEIKRGYVKWVDKEGMTHKELLVNYPDLLATASDKQKAEAEEAWEMSGKPEKPTAKPVAKVNAPLILKKEEEK